MRPLRRQRKVVIAFGASIALALSGLGLESASAATRSRLAVSLNPDRSNAVRLDGATVKGKIYVFVRNSETLDKVDFYLDGSWRTKPPIRTETDPPFDLAGTAADGTALPYDTTKLADGSHSIRVVLTWSDGGTSSRRGNFTVANKGVTPSRRAGPDNHDHCAGPRSYDHCTSDHCTSDHNHCTSDHLGSDHDNGRANDNGDRVADDVNNDVARCEWIVAKFASCKDLRQYVLAQRTGHCPCGCHCRSRR